MCKTSFITVTDTQMHYLATNVRRNLGCHLPWSDHTALGGLQLGLITLSFGHPCRVHVIFIQILKRNNPKDCAISSQSTAHSHFSSKIERKVSFETWIYSILGPIQGPEKGLM